MKRFCFIILAIQTLYSAVSAQPDTLWTKKFSGSGYASPYYVDTTDDMGFVIAGNTRTCGTNNLDLYIVKTDAEGNEMWNLIYGSPNKDEAFCIQQTQDLGYIVCGSWNRTLLGNDGDIILMKLNEFGAISWTRIIGGAYDDWAFSVQQTSDNGYIIAGSSDSPGFGDYRIPLIKFDENGNIRWRQFLGTDWDNFGESVRQTLDGGYIVAGYHQDNQIVRMYIIKTDSRGNVQWQRYFGNDIEYAHCVRQTFDGGYIVGGSTMIPGLGVNTACLLKLDPFGNTQWFRYYGTPAWEQVQSVRQTKDMGYVFTGICEFLGAGCHDVWIVKTDIAGDTLWTKVLGGPHYDWGECIQALGDNSYIVAAQYQETAPGGNNFWLIRLEAEAEGEVETKAAEELTESGAPYGFASLSVSPNPFNQQTTISFELAEAGEINLAVYDVLGREIEALGTGHWASGKYSIVWKAENQASGIYFIRLQIPETSQTQKVVLMK